jgi:hypothetical protein
MPDVPNTPPSGPTSPAPPGGESIRRLRQQAAQLLGRLLARCWLHSRCPRPAQEDRETRSHE